MDTPTAKPQGIFDRLLADPYRINMALNGLGLLGSKTAQQSQNYMGNISAGLLDQAKTKAQTKRDAETSRVNNSIIKLNTAKGIDLNNPAFFPGTGAEASALNVLTTLGAKKQQGIILTGQEAVALTAAERYLSQARTSYGPGGNPITQQMNMEGIYNIPAAPVSDQPLPVSGPVAPVPGQTPPELPLAAQQPASQPDDQVYPATPAQIQTDKLTATEYVDWTTKGEAIATKNINQLMTARNSLTSGAVETGDWKAFLSSLAPDKLVSTLRPEFMDTKEQVQEVVQANLTATLGAQFAEREGDRVIARAYNENVDTDLNVKRVNRLIDQIVQTTDAKKAAMEYYGKKGTMVGYSADVNSMADLQKKLEAEFIKGMGEEMTDQERRLQELEEELGVKY
jgi:hypothetical protein